MPDTRLLMIARCPHCRSRVRLDADAVRDLADGRERSAHCPTCQTEFPVGPDAPAPIDRHARPNEPALAAEAPAVPHRADPPFRDLVDPAADPPPFGPIDEPTAGPDPGTWWARQSRKWAALPPGRQRLYLGTGVFVLAVVVFAWPTPTSAEPPFPSSKDAATQVIRVPEPPPPPIVRDRPLDSEYVARKDIPINTRITPENFNEFVEVRQVKAVRPGGVGSDRDLRDKFARRAHRATELLAEGGFGDEIVPDPAWIQVHRQDLRSGTTQLTLYWVYVVPGQDPVRVLDPERAEALRLPAAKALLARMVRGERFPGIDLAAAPTPPTP